MPSPSNSPSGLAHHARFHAAAKGDLLRIHFKNKITSYLLYQILVNVYMREHIESKSLGTKVSQKSINFSDIPKIKISFFLIDVIN